MTCNPWFYFFQLGFSGAFTDTKTNLCAWIWKEVIERDTECSSVKSCNQTFENVVTARQHIVDLLNHQHWFPPSLQVVLQEARTAVQQQYSVIREALDEEEQTALQCVSAEETKAMGSLEEKLGHLQSSLKSIQQGLHILEGLADAKGDNSIQDQAFIAVRVMSKCEWVVRRLAKTCAQLNVFVFPSGFAGIQQDFPSVSQQTVSLYDVLHGVS